MSAREFDVVVFGATGYAGKYIAIELARQIVKHSLSEKMAIAGRTESVLNGTLLLCASGASSEVKKEILESFDISSIGVITANAFNMDSLKRMAERCKVLINCVGPFRFSGENVINACLQSRTHYVDITGEPQFMEISELKFHELAVANDVTVVSGCGFDSFPADMGAFYTRTELGVTPDSMQIYHDLHSPGLHGTTWRTAILSIDSSQELKKLREERRNLNLSQPEHYRNPWVCYNSILGKIASRFIGSDHSMVVRSQRRAGAFYNVSIYNVHRSLLSFILFLMWGFFIVLMAYFSWTRDLLMKYPEFFSMNYVRESGATLKELQTGSLRTYYIADSKDDRVIVRLDGPEPGYLLTALTSVYSALTLLKSQKCQRGVLTPSSAFGETNILQKLAKEGVEWKVAYRGKKENTRCDL